MWTPDQLRRALSEYEAGLRAAGKSRSTISTYVLAAERFVRWLDGSYQAKASDPRHVSGDAGSRRSRYEPLRRYLADHQESVLRLTFVEIERIIGRTLPKSARRYRPWWANEVVGTHAHAHAWFGAGRRTRNVDIHGETVEFVRADNGPSSADEGHHGVPVRIRTEVEYF